MPRLLAARARKGSGGSCSLGAAELPLTARSTCAPSSLLPHCTFPPCFALLPHRCAADLAALANTFEVTEPAELSPVRAVPAAQVQQTWQTCQAGGVPEDALQPSIVAETQADSEDGGESTGTAAAPPASGPATAVGGRRRLAEAGAAVVAAATAAMLQ